MAPREDPTPTASPWPRRAVVKVAATAAASAMLSPPWKVQGRSAQPADGAPREFNVRDFGADPTGGVLTSRAIQRAVNAAHAAGPGSRVVVPAGRYLTGRIELRSGIEFHLAADAELWASTEPADYGSDRALLTAEGAVGLQLTGPGRINGRSREFMSHYDEAGEWWQPKPFRPRLAVLSGCRDLLVQDVTFQDAPQWTLHLVGCEQVVVERVTIRNQLDVPNCDGIDPDHCRQVVIRHCDITCGDDAIVIKTTRAGMKYGPSYDIHVHDCVLTTQDSGLKIGTETTQDISGVRFERCRINTGCRGLCIQLRDEGSVSDVEFRDIVFEARYFADPWWGRGEGISLTAIPRTPGAAIGRMQDIRFVNITGRAENTFRISGTPESRIARVQAENVHLTLDRWTRYPGARWDNRPTTAYPPIEEHPTPAVHVRYADDVELRRFQVQWGESPPDYFTHALQAHDVSGLRYPDFQGAAAHPDRLPAIQVRSPDAVV